MKTFPNELNSKNKTNFFKLYRERTKCYLRRELYEHILSNHESNYFVIENFAEKYANGNSALVIELLNELIAELNNLNWNCTFSFGNTGLFIWSDKKPDNCFE